VDELLLDFSMEADELPTEVDDALDADEVLSASADADARHKASVAARRRVLFRRGCMGIARIAVDRGPVGGVTKDSLNCPAA
jgi:hypothetical protein